MEGQAIGSAAALTAPMGVAFDFPLAPVCRKIEGCRGAGLRESLVAAHGSYGDPGGEGSRENAPAESGESAVRADPKALECIRRVRVGANPTERVPCPGRMGDLEKSIWGFAERDGDKVV
ncbi:hypothetical protein ACQJBY_015458 [Aegilops geniculata]